MAATTLPALLLGGDPDGSAEETYAEWEKALALPGVRGLVVGRTLLYPPDGDVAAAVDTAARLVHGAPLRSARTAATRPATGCTGRAGRALRRRRRSLGPWRAS